MANINNIIYTTLINLELDGTTYYLSDSWVPVTSGNVTYMALGSMLAISGVTSQISTAQTELTLTVSGISPDANYNAIAQSSPIRGGSLDVLRYISNGPTSDASLAQSWVAFRGIINTFAVVETYESTLGETTLSLVLNAQSIQDYLYAQLRGEITNGADRRRIVTNDNGFDEVSNSFGVV